jgi:hypothetical protein
MTNLVVFVFPDFHGDSYGLTVPNRSSLSCLLHCWRSLWRSTFSRDVTVGSSSFPN